MGSSPQVRGPQEYSGSGIGSLGAHPRRCGDHSVLCLLLLIAMGSSPQVRGVHMLEENQLRVSGLIPAGAGSSPSTMRQYRAFPAHPRRCGEFLSVRRGACTCIGSSPQVRGVRRARRRRQRSPGLIPAGAGTTCSQRCCVYASEAHPRRCGDHPACVARFLPCGGSSPQVRGPQFSLSFVRFYPRLIPAGAGTTQPM